GDLGMAWMERSLSQVKKKKRTKAPYAA
ncbi:ABC transporter permease, partial [Bacillus pumilus]